MVEYQSECWTSGRWNWKIISNVEQYHQPMFEQTSSTGSMESGIHFLNTQKRIQEGFQQLSRNFGDKYNEPAIQEFWATWFRRSITILKRKNRTHSGLEDSIQIIYSV
jgi:hypothetical protein